MSESDPAEWVTIAATGDCPPGSSQELVARGRVIALFNVDGSYFALDGVCAHQGGPLGQGELNGCVVTCPWHGWQFDVTQGANQVTPQLRQPTYPLRVVQEQVQIALSAADDESLKRLE